MEKLNRACGLAKLKTKNGLWKKMWVNAHGGKRDGKKK
jgi:hypothetical protein